jgi:hypothetical protein
VKDPNEPKDTNDAMAPQQQEGEEFGSVRNRQVTKGNMRRRSDTSAEASRKHAGSRATGPDGNPLRLSRDQRRQGRNAP